jgi:transposase InsO family protein
MRVGHLADPLGPGGHGSIHAPDHWVGRPLPERLIVSHSVGCSTAPFVGNARRRTTSALITIHCIVSTNGKPICGYCNLRILKVIEIKSIPYVPLSHPFVERLIGTLRREYLDHMLFWTTADLENKLLDFRAYFNNHRTHTSLEGRTPDTPTSRPAANLRSFRWQPHCRALYQTPVAA